MPRIDIYFILLAALCLICGMCLGIFMGMIHSFEFAPIHAHLNLLGWASLAIFGLVYKSFPELAASRLAVVHFVLSSVSSVMFPAGLYFAIAYENPLFAILASLVALVGVLVFFANLVRLLGSSTNSAVVGRAAV